MSGAGFILMFIILIVVLAIVLSRKPKRELTAAERIAYESERGKLIAQQEFRGNRSRW